MRISLGREAIGKARGEERRREENVAPGVRLFWSNRLDLCSRVVRHLSLLRAPSLPALQRCLAALGFGSRSTAVRRFAVGRTPPAALAVVMLSGRCPAVRHRRGQAGNNRSAHVRRPRVGDRTPCGLDCAVRTSRLIDLPLGLELLGLQCRPSSGSARITVESCVRTDRIASRWLQG